MSHNGTTKLYCKLPVCKACRFGNFKNIIITGAAVYKGLKSVVRSFHGNRTEAALLLLIHSLSSEVP